MKNIINQNVLNGIVLTGRDKLKFSASELSIGGEPITWPRYKYVELKGFENADGSPKKRLSIVSECTAPGKLIEYFLKLLTTYPFHQFMANWQREQFDSIKEFLPDDHVLCVHDFSENYQCTFQDEIQLQYFSRGEVSIHVTMLCRHSVLDFDGVQSTPEDPIIIKEHIFTILDDLQHDSYAVQHIRSLINNYLVEKVKYNIVLLHGYTDGCSA